MTSSGTAGETYEHVSGIVRDVGKKGGLIINTGEGVTRETPEENVRAMVDAIHNTWDE